MGKQSNRVTVPKGLTAADKEAGVIPGTPDDTCYRYALAAYDRYHTAMQERYGKQLSQRTLHTAQAADRNAFFDIGQLTGHMGWDPEHFVETALSLVQLNHTYLTPASLLNKQVVEAYRQKAEMGGNNYTPESDWVYFATMLVRRLDPSQGSTEHSVLMCPMNPFPAWFRLLYPETLNDEVFQMYGTEARNELKRNMRLRVFARKKAPRVLAQLEDHWGKFADVPQEEQQ